MPEMEPQPLTAQDILAILGEDASALFRQAAGRPVTIRELLVFVVARDVCRAGLAAETAVGLAKLTAEHAVTILQRLAEHRAVAGRPH